MRIVLVLAALAVAVPAAADPGSGASGYGWASGERDERVRGPRDFERDDRDDRDRRDRRGRGGALYIDNDRDLVSDRAFQPDSFNDWWHDRPDRAYPAWVARNGKCERMWWSGGDWRC